MKIPHSDEKFEKFFRSILPDDPNVTIRPMFGNIAAFVNGNMFTGLYGEDMFVRLSDDDAKKLLTTKGASSFEPMKGRPMQGYTLIPRAWKSRPDLVRPWVSKSLNWTGKLPAKQKKAH